MSDTEKLEPGDWVVDYPVIGPMSAMCYEVRSVQQARRETWVLLRAFDTRTKDRFSCSSPIRELGLIRKKDGRVVDPPVRCA